MNKHETGQGGAEPCATLDLPQECLAHYDPSSSNRTVLNNNAADCMILNGIARQASLLNEFATLFMKLQPGDRI